MSRSVSPARARCQLASSSPWCSSAQASTSRSCRVCIALSITSTSSIRDLGLAARIAGMEMRKSVIVEVHRDRDPEEAADRRHVPDVGVWSGRPRMPSSISHRWRCGSPAAHQSGSSSPCSRHHSASPVPPPRPPAPRAPAAHQAGTPARDATNGSGSGPPRAAMPRTPRHAPRSHQRQSAARFQPPTEPRDLPKLAHRRPHHIAAPIKLRPVRIRERSQQPRHQHPADPARRPGHPLLLLRERARNMTTATRVMPIPTHRHPNVRGPSRQDRHNDRVGLMMLVPTSAQAPAPPRAVEMSREGMSPIVIQRQHAHPGVTSTYLQGIDTTETINTVHARRPPVIPASASLRL